MRLFSNKGASQPNNGTERLEPSDIELITAATSCRGFEAKSDLEQAVRHTRLIRFGRTGRYLTPLSTQFKAEIKRLFPADNDIFVKADRMQDVVHLIVFLMRIFSIAFFLAFLVQVLGAFRWLYGNPPGQLSHWQDFHPGLHFFTTQIGSSLGLLAFTLFLGHDLELT